MTMLGGGPRNDSSENKIPEPVNADTPANCSTSWWPAI